MAFKFTFTELILYITKFVSYIKKVIKKVINNKLSRIDQYLRARKAATPALIHYSSALSVGISNIITKLVEWPVVDSVPRRDTTLYTGQL